jgi:hypothetical protein
MCGREEKCLQNFVKENMKEGDHQEYHRQIKVLSCNITI